MISSLDSPYRSHIDETVLKLKEDETIRKLKVRWWKDNNFGEKNCSVEESGNDSELTMQNVGGIFLVLFTGCGIAIVIGIMEFLWNVKQVSINEKVLLTISYTLHCLHFSIAPYFVRVFSVKITPYEALVKEVKFACKIWLCKKPNFLQENSECRESSSLSSTPNGSMRKEVILM